MINKIDEIAKKLNIPSEYIDFYGNYKAKIYNEYYENIKDNKDGNLVLVTAINPTPQGEGKTTQSIAISMALNKLGKNSIVVLREPSLGPVFGVKGGAIGGGKCKIIPSQDINLHFTGDFHSITSANNLLCAVIDNHIYQGNKLNINPDTIDIKRCMDMNDRALRNIITSDGRNTGFEITAATELMAICCLAKSKDDLKRRIENILVAYNYDNGPIYVKDLNVVNAMMALLEETLKPNLVQTSESTPCIIHLGPFANIAHGCNSIIATKLGLKLSDYCITEAGFGADLGAEKYFNIKCRVGGLKPKAVILVATVRALKYNSQENIDLVEKNLDALKKGIVNLKRHIENIKLHGISPIVCINKFETDSEDEVNYIFDYCKALNVKCGISTAYADGSDGAIDVAELLVQDIEENSNNFSYLYNIDDSIKSKIEVICMKIYRASTINYSQTAEEKIMKITELGHNNLPICIAKTPLSFSDNPKLLGAPENFTITVKDIRLELGAEFIVAYLGDIVTMPGLGKTSKYEKF